MLKKFKFFRIISPFNIIKFCNFKKVKKIIFASSFTVYGNQKNKLLKQAWALILPSHSEVIGMVNLEAALLKTPSITTYKTGKRNCAFIYICSWVIIYIST